MKVGLDFDGVITDNGQLKAVAAEELFGVKIPPEHFKRQLLVPNTFSNEQYNLLLDTIYMESEWSRRMRPTEQVLHYGNRLIQDGHDIRIISSREGEALENAKIWLVDHGLEIDMRGVGPGNSKADAAAGLDVFVDDDLNKLEDLVGVVPTLYLFAWGYNSHLDESKVGKRIYGWAALYMHICQLDKGSE